MFSMQTSADKLQLRASLEGAYITAYIRQYQKYFNGIAKIQFNAHVQDSRCMVEHSLICPIIDDALRLGIFNVEAPVILFGLIVNPNSFIFSVHHSFNPLKRDEEMLVNFEKLKLKLEAMSPQKYVLYRNFYLDSYFFLLKLEL
jgi:hypothetical protein